MLVENKESNYNITGFVKMQESKLYGAHFREISADAPKAKKITFDDSDNEANI